MNSFKLSCLCLLRSCVLTFHWYTTFHRQQVWKNLKKLWPITLRTSINTWYHTLFFHRQGVTLYILSYFAQSINQYKGWHFQYNYVQIVFQIIRWSEIERSRHPLNCTKLLLEFVILVHSGNRISSGGMERLLFSGRKEECTMSPVIMSFIIQWGTNNSTW